MIRTVKFVAVLFALATLKPVMMQAQKTDKDKDKDKKVERVIVTTTGDTDQKMTIVIDGDKVTVNGKDVKDLKDKEVKVMRIREGEDRHQRAFTINGDQLFEMDDQNFNFFNEDENKAMLGVMTDREDKGAKINQVTKESAAEKAGLKEGDIITKVDDNTISDPDDLTKAIQNHKPGEKVKITYLRNGKSQSTTAELGKWKGFRVNAFNMAPGFTPDMNIFERINPHVQGMPRIQGQGMLWESERPKLGISVQDTEDGKGVKVVDVEDESTAAKAGIKEDDIITSVDDKAVNSTDEIARLVRERRDKASMMMKLTRNGKVYNMEVKIPRRIKTAEL
jgi:Trypsin-like serine proteases, typically periplasmic, contain C-terminal PDZ domain